jgi:hypothetical protein
MPVLLGAIVALVVGLGAGTAYGYFASAGHGSGAASTGTVQNVTVMEASGTVTSPLYPGNTAGDLLLKIVNPNSYSLTLTSITLNSPATPDSGHSSCTTTGVSLNADTGLTITVPTGTTTLDVPNAVSMSSSSSSGCQGATFQLPVTITVQKG